jgi:hypothetical protein
MVNQNNEPSQEKYQNSIVAYADILGWKEATKNRDIKTLFEPIKSIEDFASNFTPEVKNTLEKSSGISDQLLREHGGIEFSLFSDCFAVSAPATMGKVVFKILAFASDELLRKGFLLRGGVTLGQLYHKQRILFGPALIEAIEMEQKDAVFSRFLCSRELIQFLDCTDYKDEVVLRDCCEGWVVNIATGSTLARDELMKIINEWLDENEIKEEERFVLKWRYLQRMLPVMFEQFRTFK